MKKVFYVRYSSAKDREDALLEALKNVLTDLPGPCECVNFSHGEKKDRHKLGEKCPPKGRYDTSVREAYDVIRQIEETR